MPGLPSNGGAHARDPFLPRHTIAGRYTIERELGRGGMATVYLARDLRHQRMVALKVLRPELTGAMDVHRFHREIRIACSLEHPHILSVFDSDEVDGQVYFAMPYIAGETLRRRIVREKRLATDEAVRLTCETADALAYAHEHGVVHRDIKPENILLSGGHAVVADFGISRAAEDTLTSAGLVVGTPAYMSPEQASGDRVLDGRSDIYSLACVLYTMLTGKALFEGPTPQAVAAQHVTAPPPSVRAERPDVPASLEAVLQRALAKDRTERFDNARQFAAALTQACQDVAGATGAGSAGAGSIDRRALLARGATISALVLAAVLVWERGSPASPVPGEPPLLPGLVAVAPFAVASGDARLQHWKAHLPMLVTGQLDGAGPLSAQPPGIGDTAPVIERKAAERLGRRVRARYVVFGFVTRDREHTVRVQASILDVARGDVIDQVEVTSTASDDDPERLLHDVSSALSRDLLVSFNAATPVAATRRAAFSCATTSEQARKKYLQGDRFYRLTQWDDAIAAYNSAIELDSTCALAYRRIAIALSWQRHDDDPEVLHYKRLAGMHNRGLPPRDSLLVVADSLMASVHDMNASSRVSASVMWAQADRLLSTLQSASARYPGDAEIWYALGEARYHWGWGPARTTPAEILAAFDAAIRQDSGFALPYPHAIELALTEGGAPFARRYIDGYLAASPADAHADGLRLVAALTDANASRSPEVAQRLATDSIETLQWVLNRIDRWHDPGETAVRLARIIAAREGGDTLQIAACRGGHPPQEKLATMLAYRGHLREALCALGDSVGGAGTRGTLVELALLGAVPADEAERVFDEWLRAGQPMTHYLLPWLTARRDSARIDALARRADSLQRNGGNAVVQERARYTVRAANAYRTLARLDTIAALRQFGSLPGSPCKSCFDFDRLTYARLLASRDSVQAAYRILGEWRGATAAPSNILAVYERARLAERIGKRADAVAAYRTVVEAWANGDPVLQGFVVDARRGLARLEGTRADAGP